MKHVKALSGKVLACVVLAACAAVPSPGQLREQNSAFVRGYETSFLKNLFTSNETKAAVRILAVDGATKWHWRGGYAKEARLTAGPRRLTLLCFGRLDRRPFEYQVTLALDARAGEIYQLDPRVRADGCEVSVRKMTGKGR